MARVWPASTPARSRAWAGMADAFKQERAFALFMVGPAFLVLVLTTTVPLVHLIYNSLYTINLSMPYLDGFAAALERQGYRPATAVRYLRAAAHVGHIVVERGGSLGDIDLAAFSEHLRTCRCPRANGGRRNHHTIYGARLFRRHLVESGVCLPADTAAAHVEPQ